MVRLPLGAPSGGGIPEQFPPPPNHRRDLSVSTVVAIDPPEDDLQRLRAVPI